MRTEVIYSSSNDPKEAHQQINEKLRTLNIKPNFLFLFLTAGTWKAYEDFNKLLENYFPDAKMLGCIVEGYIAEDEIWTRGVSILLAEFDGEVEVFWANEDSATETVEKLGDKIGEGWDSILLMFPAFYFPGKLEFMRFFFNDKRYYRSFVKNKDNSKGIEALEGYSKYLDEKKMLYPINYVLREVSEKTGKNIPIMGMSLMPLEAFSHTPLILANYENIENGIGAICFKGEVNSIFHDVFPERGSNYEETLEIIKNYFPGTEKVNVTKLTTAIGEIDGLKPMDFLRVKKEGLQELSQEDFLKNIENGKQMMVSPYLLSFISKKTYGSTFLALINSPTSIYPSLFDLEYFYDDTAFIGEIFRGGIHTFGKIFDFKRYNNFDFLVIDFDTIMSFGGDVYKLTEFINRKSKSCFGVFSCPPSAYIPKPNTRFMSEIEKGLFVNCTGTSFLLDFK